MNQEQFNALLAYIDARIDEQIADAFGRDSLYESIETSEKRKNLYQSFYLDIDR